MRSHHYIILALTACTAAVADSGTLHRFVGGEMTAAACCDRARRTAWLAGCVEEGRAVRPGMPRSELLKRFEQDGGLGTPGRTHFNHRHCHEVKIRVDFDFSGRASDDGQPRLDDVVSGVFGPYIGPQMID